MIRIFFLLLPLTMAVTSLATSQPWTPILHTSGIAAAVAVHPLDPTVLALTWQSEVSFDAGQTWAAFGEGVRERAEFAFDPNDTMVWYLITWGDVDNPGKRLIRVTWHGERELEVVADRANLAGGIPAAVAVHPHDSHVIYVGTSRGALFRSGDRGANWRPILEAGPADSSDHHHPLAQVLPGPGGALAVNNPTDRTTFFRSTDDGATWELGGANLDGRSLNLLAVLPDDPEVLYVSAHGPEGGDSPFPGLLQTSDGGATWRQLLRANTVTAFAVDRSDPLRLAIGTQPAVPPAGTATSGVLFSEDGGDSWHDISIPTSAVVPGADEAISLAFAGETRLLATTKQGMMSLQLPLSPTSVRVQSWARVKSGSW